MQSVCGVICETDCRAYKVECDGCNKLDGKVSWAVFYGKDHCPIYACVSEKGLSSCVDCGLAPCDVWFQTRNPEVTDEAFQQDINSRLANLAKRAKEIE